MNEVIPADNPRESLRSSRGLESFRMIALSPRKPCLPRRSLMSLLVHDLCKSFPTRSGDLVVLRNIHLEMQPGDALAVLGPSGSGKSTLLHLLGTLDRPTSGNIQLDGQNPFSLGDKELARFRNHQVGFVFQDHHLLPQCSVLENVLIPTLAAPCDRAAAETWARELLERVG